MGFCWTPDPVAEQSTTVKYVLTIFGLGGSPRVVECNTMYYASPDCRVGVLYSFSPAFRVWPTDVRGAPSVLNSFVGARLQCLYLITVALSTERLRGMCCGL